MKTITPSPQLFVAFSLFFMLSIHCFAFQKNDHTAETSRIYVSASIHQNTSKQSLEAIKQLLKEDFKIDIAYKKLDFNANNNISKLKVKVTTQTGYQASIAQSNNKNSGIPGVFFKADFSSGAQKTYDLGSFDSDAQAFYHGLDLLRSNLQQATYVLINGEKNTSEALQKSIIAMDAFQLRVINKDTIADIIGEKLAYSNFEALIKKAKQNELSQHLIVVGESNHVSLLENQSKSDKFVAQPILPKTNDIIATEYSGKNTILANMLNSQQEKPLVLIDGKIASLAKLNQLEEESIESLSIIKNQEAVKTYGSKAKNGVIKIVLAQKTSENQSKQALAPSFLKISETTSDEELESICRKAQNVFDMRLTYNGLKRNTEGLITAIHLSGKTEKASTSAKFESNTGILPIYVGIKSENIIISSQP